MKSASANDFSVVITANAGIQCFLGILDDSLRSPFGPPAGRSTRCALLSGFRRNDRNPSLWDSSESDPTDTERYRELLAAEGIHKTHLKGDLDRA